MKEKITDQTHCWWWAASETFPAAEKFVIARGTAELNRRVRREIDKDEICASNPIADDPDLGDVLEVFLTATGIVGVERDKTLTEMAQIPAFAKFLRDENRDLRAFVSSKDSARLLEEQLREAPRPA